MYVLLYVNFFVRKLLTVNLIKVSSPTPPPPHLHLTEKELTIPYILIWQLPINNKIGKWFIGFRCGIRYRKLKYLYKIEWILRLKRSDMFTLYVCGWSVEKQAKFQFHFHVKCKSLVSEYHLSGYSFCSHKTCSYYQKYMSHLKRAEVTLWRFGG